MSKCVLNTFTLCGDKLCPLQSHIVCDELCYINAALFQVGFDIYYLYVFLFNMILTAEAYSEN